MRLALTPTLLGLVAVSAGFTQPSVFTYQGRLLDASGVPVTSPTVVRIAIFRGGDANTAGSGALAYQETFTVTPDATGIFSRLIGENPDAGFGLSAGVFQTTQPLFLQLNVPFDGPAVLPRTQLLSVPYAQVASQLTRAQERVPIPIIGAHAFFGAGVQMSDSAADLPGLTFADNFSLAAADAQIPSTWNNAPPVLEMSAELFNVPLAPEPASNTAVFSFRLRGLEFGGSITFEGPHTFTTTAPEVFQLPIAAQSGTIQPGELATWSFNRRAESNQDLIPGAVMVHRAQLLMNTAR